MKNQVKLRKLEVILKTVERCNLNCNYCYFFHGADQSYKLHPPSIPWQILKNIVSFLQKAIEDFEIDVVQIDFHGGEPTLQKKEAFDKMCSFFHNELGSITSLTLALQSNATLIDDAWIDLFCKHHVSIGVSLDGTKEMHDKFRIDFKGRGSYDRTIEGIQKLQNAERQGKVGRVGALCVINPNNDAEAIYNHIVYDLKIHHMDFLLPDHTHDSFKNEDPEPYGKFFCCLFKRWAKDDNVNITIRCLNSYLQLFVGNNTLLQGIGPKQDDIMAITISSNGDLSPDDSLRSGIKDCINKFNISTTSFSEFFHSPLMQGLLKAESTLPTSCQSCCWEKICCGGRLLHRYSSANAFDNPSIYCAGLKEFYVEIVKYLIENGIKIEKIKETLLIC